MLLDFTEISDDHAFENFCMHFLQEQGLRVTVAPALGPDGGRDIICDEPSRFGAGGYRWLVSCKHFAGSGTSVGINKDEAKANKLTEHQCNAFMFCFSTAYTEGFRSAVERVCQATNSHYKIFNCYDIERILFSSVRMFPLIRQYFPKSHGLLVRLRNTECCDRLNADDNLYAVYTRNDLNAEVSYQTFGDCCIEQFLDYLRSENIDFGITKIREATW
jgi:hypothetical protein